MATDLILESLNEGFTSGLASPALIREQSRLSLVELFPSFPLTSDPLFAGKIVAKREFSELVLTAEPEDVSAGQLFKSQLMGSRILAPNSTVKEQLFYNEVGTGKTCIAVAVAEAYKHALVGPGRKRALVVVSGETVEQSFRTNLVNICTQGSYLPPASRTLTQAGRDLAVDRMVREWYQMEHYLSLARRLSTMTDEEINNEFSDRVIIFDESHRLRMGYSRGVRLVNQSFEEGSARLEEIDQELSRLRSYDLFWRLLHTAQRIIKIFLTATPIIDHYRELTLQLNLLLSEDQQIPIDFDWLNPDLAFLQPRLNGLISHVRSSSSVARVIEQGTLVNLQDPVSEAQFSLRLVLHPMSEDQFFYYNRISNRQRGELPSEEEPQELGRNPIRLGERYTSLFIYPRTPSQEADVARIEEDPNLTPLEKEDLVRRYDRQRDVVSARVANEHILVENGSFSIRPESNLELYLSNPQLLSILSSKLEGLVEEVVNHPQELAFIFMEFVNVVGVYLLALIFESRGYQRYLGEPFYLTRPDGTRSIRLSKARRYVVITSATPRRFREEALRVFRAPENRYGDYLQVLIGSEVTGEAISFRNVRQVHLPHPFWVDVPMHQGIGRALREGAHDDLPPQERYVKTYFHASIGPQGQLDVIDIQMYAWAEGKRYRNSQALRVIKQFAWNCSLTKERNQNRGEQDFSRNCDYSPCQYPCFGSEVDLSGNPLLVQAPDDSSYFAFYSTKEQEEIRGQVVEALRVEAVVDVNQLSEQASAKYIYSSLAQLINRQEPIASGFGQSSYLKEQNGSYFLQSDPIFPEKSLAEYAQHFVVSNPISLEQIIAPLRLQENLEGIRVIEQSDPNSPSFSEQLIAETEETKAVLLERALLALLNNQGTPLHQKIIEILQGRWYLLETNPFTNQEEPIYLHDILIHPTDRRKNYGVTTKNRKDAGKIRVLMNTGGNWANSEWRQVLPEEATAYFDLIREIDDARRLERFQGGVAFGEISTINGAFYLKIRDPEEITTVPQDRRDINRGQNCGNIPIQRLIELAYRLDLPTPPLNRELNRTREQMTNEMSRRSFKQTDFSVFSDAQVLYYYTWFQFNTPAICSYIRDFLQERGLLYWQ